MTHYPTVPPLHEAPVSEWIRHHMYRSLGLTLSSSDEVEKAVAGKRDPQVDRLRNARLAMGHLRYGLLGAANCADYDKIESVRRRLDEYAQSGNREHLIDILNLIEIEWIWPSREGTYFKALDNGGHWSLRNQAGAQPKQP